MSLKMKLNIVNKHEYEENEDYREIIIKIPKEIQKLERDFLYLGLNYNNLSIQDTHVIECEVIDTTDPAFSATISTKISNIIESADEEGYTTPYQDIKKMFAIIKTLDSEDKYKLLAILESRRKEISNIKDAIKFANNINCFELLEVDDEKELARKLIKNQEIDIEELMEYADLYTLGKDVAANQKIIKTEQGYLRQESDLKNEIKKEEEEEFE